MEGDEFRALGKRFVSKKKEERNEPSLVSVT
jgi:hypothetical protein